VAEPEEKKVIPELLSEESSDDEFFEWDYALLYCIKNETDADTVNNKLMENK